MPVNPVGPVQCQDSYQEIDMIPHLSPTQRLQFGADLQGRRNLIDSQRSAQLGGGSRAEHARDVLLQDGDDATQRDRDAVTLVEIDGALQRLADGSYGLCADCGEAIALARLQSLPQAQRCLACEALQERGASKPATL
jgi:DnaK suppressor protein